MSAIREDIKKQSDWIVKTFDTDGLKLDYTVKSFAQIDTFFELNSKNGKPIPGSKLSQNLETTTFSIGSYIGETVLKSVQRAAWKINDNDPQAKMTASVKLPDGTVFWPMRKVMRRFQNGSGDSFYAYGHNLITRYLNEPFDQTLETIKSKDTQKTKKPWWKFW
jgi:hypothetical protein